MSRAPTPAPPVAFTIAPSSNNKLLKQFMKAYSEAQVPGRIAWEVDTEFCEQPLKAWFSDLYYGNLYIDCYRFCQQCEDYFKTAGAKRPNRISFAALFLHGFVT